MKKTILIVLGVILGIVVVSGTTYMITKNLLDKETQTEKEPEENNNSNNESTNNEVTLTQTELAEYLKYVPNILDKNKYALNEIDSSDLINSTLQFVEESDFKRGTCTDNCPNLIRGLREENSVKSYHYVETSLINNLLNKMYNVNFDSLKIDSDAYFVGYGKIEVFTGISETDGICAIYYNDSFVLDGDKCYVYNPYTRELKNYTATNEELIIYSYDFYFTNGGYVCHIDDSKNCVPGPDWGASIDKEKDYSLCKHTFKKNDTGYYWYSTEVVK